MTKARSIIAKPVPEVRFWACFAVIFALISQALFPVQAMAVTMGHTSGVMCGVDSATDFATSPSSEKSGVMGLKCADCVVASITAVPSPLLTLTPVLYTLSHVVVRPARARSLVKARAPPRPHSCGPPSEIQA